MRRTPTTLAVATELLAGEPGHARWSYEIATKLDCDRGSVNTILRRMANAGWLRGYWEEADEVAEGRPRRRLYCVTEPGNVKLRALIARKRRSRTSIPDSVPA